MLTHERLLQMQRNLFDIPRGRERFDTYIAALTDDAGEMALPLSAMNPMAKEHVPALLDTYLALDVDTLADAIVQQLQPTHPFGTDRFQTALVLADDAHGQWTNRVSTDFANRFESRPMFRRGWLVALLWTSEPASADRVQQALTAAIYRGLWIADHGFAENLEQMLAQERYALTHAGLTAELDSDELDYTADLLAPLLQRDDMPTLIAALYGDAAAQALGYPQLGLSPNAGFHLARR